MDMNVTMKDPKKSDYYYEESIKTLRTNIQFSSKQVKTILLTSCYQNEGKSDIYPFCGNGKSRKKSFVN